MKLNIIKKTKSICPKCTLELNSRIIEEDDKVCIVKECKKHSKFKILISKDADYYKKTSDFYSAFDLRKNKNFFPPIFLFDLIVIESINSNLIAPNQIFINLSWFIA